MRLPNCKSLVHVLLLAVCGCSGAEAPSSAYIDTDRGTWMNVDVSPDGAHIVFDHLGVIHTLPVTGGRARPLVLRALDDAYGTEFEPFSHSPAYSPDGRFVAFVSDASGAENVWVVEATGIDARQLTFVDGKGFSSPVWTDDGSAILVRRSDNLRDGEIWRIEPGNSRPVPVGTRQHFFDAQGPETYGDTLYLAAPTHDGTRRPLRRETWQIMAGVAGGGFDRVTDAPGGAVRPRVSPDGRWLAYASWHEQSPSIVVSERETGEVRFVLQNVAERNLQDMYIAQLDLFPGYAFSPDSQSLFLAADGRLQRVDINTGDSVNVPFRIDRVLDTQPNPVPRLELPAMDFQPRIIRWPAVGSDNNIVVEALGRLWRPNAGGGKEWTPITPDTMFAAQPDVAGDGRIAFIAADARGARNIYLHDLKGNFRRLTEGWSAYSAPRFCLDGSCVIAVKGPPDFGISLPGSAVKRELVLIDLDSGTERSLAKGTFSEAGAWPASEDGPLFAMGSDGLLRVDPATGAADVAIARGDADLIVPSPSGGHVAVVINNHVFATTFERAANEIARLSSDPPPYADYPGELGSFPRWLEGDRLMWGAPGEIRIGSPDALEQAKSIEAEIRQRMPQHGPALVLRGARVITASATGTFESADVVVADGRIRCVADAGECAVPEDASIVDAEGKTIIPGLIDTHQHAVALAGGDANRNIPAVYPPASLLLAYGVTSTRDPALLSNYRDFGLIEAINSGRIPGARYLASGERIMPEKITITSPQDATAAVADLVRLGATCIKEYLLPDRRQRVWLRRATSDVGIVSAFEGGYDFKLSMTAFLDGYTTVEHSAGNHMLHDDAVQLMLATEARYTPTILTQIGAEFFYRSHDINAESRLRRFIGDRGIQLLLQRRRRGQGVADAETAYRALIESAAAAANAGVPVLVGAHDSPAPTGLGTHWEMWALVAGGMSPQQVLEAATIEGARALGIDHETGSVEAGKRADLLILGANPLDDIHNTLSVETVLFDGRRFDSQTLIEE